MGTRLWALEPVLGQGLALSVLGLGQAGAQAVVQAGELLLGPGQLQPS